MKPIAPGGAAAMWGIGEQEAEEGENGLAFRADWL